MPAQKNGLRVDQLRRYYQMQDGEPTGPYREMTFAKGSLDYLPSLLSFAQFQQSGFPPVPDARLCGGISLPGPHLVLLWW